MAYLLAGERVTITAGDLDIEVAPVVAWPIAHTAARLADAYNVATPGDAELVALRELYGFFVVEAQPEWDIVDHRGRIAPTTAGMLRLPLDLALSLIGAWLDTITPKSTAVDELVPPGPVRDALNTALKSKRRKQEPGG